MNAQLESNLIDRSKEGKKEAPRIGIHDALPVLRATFSSMWSKVRFTTFQFFLYKERGNVRQTIAKYTFLFYMGSVCLF